MSINNLNELNNKLHLSMTQALKLNEVGKSELANKYRYEYKTLLQEMGKVLGEKEDEFKVEWNSQIVKQYPDCVGIKQKFAPEERLDQTLKCIDVSQEIVTKVIDMFYNEVDVLYHSDPCAIKPGSIVIDYDHII